VEAWLSGAGPLDGDGVREVMSYPTDAVLADELIDNGWLDSLGADQCSPRPSRADIVAAFAAARRRLTDGEYDS